MEYKNPQVWLKLDTIEEKTKLKYYAANIKLSINDILKAAVKDFINKKGTPDWIKQTPA